MSFWPLVILMRIKKQKQNAIEEERLIIYISKYSLDVVMSSLSATAMQIVSLFPYLELHCV